jgi:hypothetical protein
LIDRLIHKYAPDYYIGQSGLNFSKKNCCGAKFSIATDITGLLVGVKTVLSPTNDRFSEPQNCCDIVKNKVIFTSGPNV